MGRFRKAMIVALVLTLVATGVGSLFFLKRWGRTPSPTLVSETLIDFAPRTRLRDLSRLLEATKAVDQAIFFEAFVRLNGTFRRFQAGTYRVRPGMTPAEIVDAIATGEIYEPVVLKFTIPEGFNVRQVAARLAALKVGLAIEIEALAADTKFISALRIGARSLEGYLYPATYSFTKVPMLADVLKEMVGTFWKRMPPGYEADLNALGLTLAQGVIFASMIEVETRWDDERSLISEVVWNRIRANMPLAIDAALIYGIKDYRGDIRWEHLRDASNPYNTRIHMGLPPTAICSPTAASMRAVLNPSREGYFYYTVDAALENRHHFSKTLSEHNAYVKKLVHATRPPTREP